MKKKSPPYAIIAAVILGVAAIFLFVKWKNAQQLANDQKLDQARKDFQIQIDEMKKSKLAPVVNELPPTNQRPVLYATQPVGPGTHISPAFFEAKLTPSDILPDAFTEQDKAAVIGLIATRNIEKGDPLTPRNTGKTLPYMSQRIPAGMRVITLSVFSSDAVNNAGGFVVDGDHVDLLYTTVGGLGGVVKTEMIMQNVDVLFVPGPAIKSEYTEAVQPVPGKGVNISVTFLVTPEQAQALIFLSQIKNGRFSMILRSRKDTTEIKLKAFALEDYPDFKKVQKYVDKSADRVRLLGEEIENESKKQVPGNTNETPTPPTP